MYRPCFPAIALQLPAIAFSLAVSSAIAKPSESSADYTAKPYSDSGNPWFTAGEKALKDKADAFQAIRPEKGAAKNVILFVGDGMGISTITAARILDGQNKGMSGEENTLSFGRLPFSGLSKTYNVDQQTPDSAGTMSAMMTGVKTDAGVISIDEMAQRGDCVSGQGHEVFTALELAEIAGLSTGVVTTARLTHATPAATYAHATERDWEDVSDMPQTAVEAGCEDIASQFVSFREHLTQKSGVNVNGLEVAMGGGRRHFLPKDAAFNSADAESAVEGDRTDGRNLITDWQSQYPEGKYIDGLAGFDAIDPETTTTLFGLFNESHMRYVADRPNDVLGEPTLAQMTRKAIQMLDNNPQGYFLMVEAGRIDHGHHAGNAYNALGEAIELSDAVQAALDATDDKETLIIVTADHSHVFTMAGYPKRGNPILGKVIEVGKDQPQLMDDGLPYTTLGYMNGMGFHDLGDETDADVSYDLPVNTGRKDLSGVDTTAPGFHQEALHPRESETHGGEDVGIFATGPGAHLVTGVNEQNVIFHIMNHAAALESKATAARDAVKKP